jgi:tRNA-specific 2-thiouridylase
VVGRNKDENEVIKALASDRDIIIEAKDYVGPTCILRCKNYDNSLLTKCAEIAARYSDAPKLDSTKVLITINGKSIETMVTLADLETMETLRI